MHTSKAATWVIADNFIHDHVMWGHPDNLQFYNEVNDVTIEGNVLLNGFQSIMLESTSGGRIINNLIAGSLACSVMLGHNNSYPYKIIGNTVALTGYSPIWHTEPNGLTNPADEGFTYDYELKNNIVSTSYRPKYGFGWPDPNVFANYNLVSDGFCGWYEDGWAYDLNEWQALSGLDANSKVADPLFLSVPESYTVAEHPYFCTRQRVYLRSSEGFEISDHVEVNFDGFDRIVTAKGSEPYTDRDGNDIMIDYIEIEPPLPKSIPRYAAVANWKGRQVSELDFRLQRQVDGYPQDSPALGMGQGNVDVGHEVDLPSLRRADFDGDGIIDDPKYRPRSADLDSDRDIDFTDYAIFARSFADGDVDWIDLSSFVDEWLS
ncbi:MAG: hypothetical protein ACYS21_21125, partial [Planctomycetota bacterium]